MTMNKKKGIMLRDRIPDNRQTAGLSFACSRLEAMPKSCKGKAGMFMASILSSNAIVRVHTEKQIDADVKNQRDEMGIAVLGSIRALPKITLVEDISIENICQV